MECPTDEQLARNLIGSGSTSDPEWESHLSECSGCRRRLIEAAESAGQGLAWEELQQTLSRLKDPRQPSWESSWARVRDHVSTWEFQSPSWPELPGYQLIAEIGRGASAVVYRARQLSPPRDVAIKVLRGSESSDPRAFSRFRAEIETVARLNHRNIVPVLEVGQHQGVLFFTMPFLEEGSLSRHLTGRPWPSIRAATLVRDLARAVAVAHASGIVHRDIKPANVLLQSASTESGLGTPEGSNTTEWIPKLTDFGIAKSAESDRDLTRTGDIVGTPCYMAPEQINGELAVIGPHSDVYSLGAMLYELLTGQPPFKAATTTETLLAVIHSDPVPPEQLCPELPRDLSTICQRALARRPAARYSDAATLADELSRYLMGIPIRARQISRWERWKKWAIRNPSTAVAVAIGGLAALVLLGSWGVFTWRLNETAQRLETERTRNLQSFESAFEAIHDYLQEVQSSPHLADDAFLELRLDLLDKGTRFYRELLDGNRITAQLPSAKITTERVNLELARLHFTLGKLNHTLERYPQALEQFELAEAACAAVLGPDFVPSQSADAGLPGALWLARSRSLLEMRDLTESRRSAERGLAYFQKLAGTGILRPDYDQWYLAESWLRLGELELAAEGWVAAEHAYSQALEQARSLPAIPDFNLSRAQADLGIGESYLHRGGESQAEPYLRSSWELVGQVVRLNPRNSRYTPTLIKAAWLLARSRKSDRAAAISILQQAVSDCREFAALRPGSQQIRQQLQSMLLELANLLEENGERSAAESLQQEAKQLAGGT